MAEIYPMLYLDRPITPEAGVIRDTALRLGVCAIQSNPEVVAVIGAPDDDVDHLLANMPGGSLYAGSHDWFASQAAGFVEQDEETALRLVASFDAVLALEEETHGLVAHGDRLTAQFTNDRTVLGSGHALHLDASKPYHPRSRFGRLLPVTYFSTGNVGAVRYTVSFGSEAEEAGTRFVAGRVTKDEMRDKSQLESRIHAFPAGSVVRFMAESGVHERSPLRRPRVFLTDTRWRGRERKWRW